MAAHTPYSLRWGMGLALVAQLSAAAAPIEVEVNRRPVHFTDTGAVRQEGRVLIPLRAVGEELGATIRWDAARRTVLGEKGTRRFELPVGTRQAILDGRVVALDVPAQMIRGTIVVPLRFVAEALGAEVKWDGTSGRVVVNTDGQGGTSAAATGSVSGEIVVVDTRAQPPRIVVAAEGRRASYRVAADTIILRGPAGERATRVEADQLLPGDRVQLRLDADGERVTVIEATTDDPASLLQPTGRTAAVREARVSSFRHDAEGPLTAGSEVLVTLAGTPGGQATFDVGSIARDVPMAEDRAEPGHYVGRYVIPGGVTEREVPLIGRLRVGSAAAPLIQAGAPLVIDSQPPGVSNAAPADGSVVRNQRPNIYAEFGDGGGTGLDVESVRLRVNGQDVTQEARVIPGFVIYTPATLAAGPVSVSVEAKDRAGNPMRKTWKFTVAAQEALIESVTHDAQGALGAGDVVTVQVTGRPGARATFNISGVASSVAMAETTAGDYIGRYTVKRGDQQLRAEVAATLMMPSGERQTLSGSAPLRIVTRELEAPTIMSPGPEEAITSPLVVMGRGEPGAKVIVEILYSARALGVLPVSGTAATCEVAVGPDGTFKTEPLALRVPRGASRVAYELRVSPVGADGETTPPAAGTDR
jgi:hypothetical protein